jgi:F-type H+-transporting ATPase subunit epsilon
MADASGKPFQFELVSPEKVLFSGEASMVVIPGEEGDFGVLYNHAPLLSSIRPGVVTITLPSGEKKAVFVANGFADVDDNVCSVVAEEAEPVIEIDRAAVEEKLKTLRESLARAAGNIEQSAPIYAEISAAEEKLKAAA